MSEPAINEYVSVVPTVTIDAVAERLRLQPDVLKIDVEGAELSVLKGALDTLRKSRPIILIEIHSEELLAACIAFLGPLGYEFEPLPADFLAKYVKP